MSYFFDLAFPMLEARDYTCFFFALALWVLERSRKDRAPWWVLWFAPVFTLWANFHAGFVSGLGVVLLYALGRAIRKESPWPHLALAVLGALAALANPYGPGLYLNVVRLTAHAPLWPVEWRPLFAVFPHPAYTRYGVLFLLYAILAFALGRREVRTAPCAWLVLGVTFLMGLKSIRHMTFFVMATAVYLPAWIEAAFQPVPAVRPLGQAIKKRPVAAFLLFMGLSSSLFLAASHAAFSATLGGPFTFRALSSRELPFGLMYYPVEAMDFLEDNRITGNLQVGLPWPGYAIWRLNGRVRTGVDNRWESAFPGEILEKEARFFQMEPGWESFLDEFPHQILLINDTTPLFEAMVKRPDWVLTFHCPGSAVFIKKDEMSGQLE
ncbi:MAG: hypothetical protein KKA60_06135 [Proteobacteria bacterium]|nr:hypothetical protein [Pseudomonadota bacterium]